MRRSLFASCLTALVVASASLLVVAPASDAALGRHYHNGVFGQAEKFCRATATYTPSHEVRTQIVRHSDGWTNTIATSYRKFKHCEARQMTTVMWCTTKLVDGFSAMCITPRPRAGGPSPCKHPRLDVRGVYYPRTGVLKITCVNE
jgi:hypothetical protein